MRTLRLAVLIASAALGLCRPAVAQDRPLDGNYPKVAADRSAYGRVIYLFGDSRCRKPPAASARRSS